MWTGIVAGLYVCVIFVTGAALVFRIDLQWALDPHLFTPRVAGPLADAATVMERVSDEVPGYFACRGWTRQRPRDRPILAYVTTR